MRRSLRLRLLLSTSLASAAVLALLGVAIYGLMWRLLLSQFDAGLLTKAKAIAAMVEQHGPDVTFDVDLDQMPEFAAGRRADYFEVWLGDRNVLARSASLGKRDLSTPQEHRAPVFMDADLPDGHDGRIVTLSVPPRVEHDETDAGKPTPTRLATIVVAGRPGDMHHVLEILRWLLLTLCGAAVVASGVVLYQLVGRAVRPVRQLAGEIESLRETELSRRLSDSNVPVELMPVVDKLNDLLARLQDSFTREKSFTADVAHELRTPLAGLATTLEVCRSRPREPAVYQAAIDDCRAMTDRMQAMVESLLMLARSDAGQLVVDRQRVDLVPLVDDCWALFRIRAESRGLVVKLNMPDRCEVDTDPGKLRIVLNNLFDNAVSYTDEHGTIELNVKPESSDRATIEVTNTGSQIKPADLPRLFDRFYRGDQSRTDTGVHCGLGLSLCQRLTRLIGGKIDVDLSRPGEFKVILLV